VNAAGIALVRDLVRMGLAVGANVEHPVTLELIDGLARDLAQPVIEALDPSTVFEVDSAPQQVRPATAEPPICGWHGPKQCVRPPGHGGRHLSNSGTSWPNESTPAGVDPLSESSFAKGPCDSVHMAHGQCVLGADHPGGHGTQDGTRIWHGWRP
jgi:hypothetical protein